jgi:hypothetical protein
MTNVIATGSGGGTNNYGIVNSSSSPTMTNVIATGSGGGTNNYGIVNSSSSPTITNTTATASDGTYNIGVINGGSGTVKINHSVIKGTFYTILTDGIGITRVANTQLDGAPVFSFSDPLTCVGAYSGAYVALNATCE